MILFISFLAASDIAAEEPRRIGITDPLPYRTSPIDYFDDKADDPVSHLIRRMDTGEVILTAHETSGYLLDLLKHLRIPVESQTLVFSKTSVHQRWISPKNPRAIYFNDEVSVGWVPGAPVLEIAAQDPFKGSLFYTLAQPMERSSQDGSVEQKPIELKREERCITCHVSSATLNVPGHLLRSFVVNEKGEPQNGFSPVTQATLFERRWGGWYVTGQAVHLTHLGNLFGSADASRHELDHSFRGTLPDVASLVDLKRFPSAHSDIVALLVLQHQLQFYNLVTRVQYEHQFNRRSNVEEQLAQYAMMEDEAPLPGPIQGSTEYAKWYQTAGSEDGADRSLRELDLKTKLYRRGLSPLIKSRSFESLPQDVVQRLKDRFTAAGHNISE